MLPATMNANALKNWIRAVCSEDGAGMTPVALVTDVDFIDNLFYCAPGHVNLFYREICNLEKLFDADFKDKSRIGGDSGTRLLTIGQVGGDDELAGTTDVHAHDTHIHTLNDVSLTDLELEGLLAVA